MEGKDYPFIVNFFEPEYTFLDYSMEDWYYVGSKNVQDILLTMVILVNSYGSDEEHTGKKYINKANRIICRKFELLNDEEQEYVIFRIKDAIKRIEEKSKQEEKDSVLFRSIIIKG